MNAKKSFTSETYKNIGIDQLVIYAVSCILNSGEECTFDRLVYECFTLFPEKFAFPRYSQWPDSSRINKSWLRCRTDKGWLSGNTRQGFRLTPLGENIANETSILLGSHLNIKKRKRITRSREKYEAIIRYIINSPVYKNYINQKKENISEEELISFLGGTLETPKRILRSNINLYFDAIKIYKKQNILPFLEICEKKLTNLRD
jgi:hypothetical protein